MMKTTDTDFERDAKLLLALNYILNCILPQCTNVIQYPVGQDKMVVPVIAFRLHLWKCEKKSDCVLRL